MGSRILLFSAVLLACASVWAAPAYAADEDAGRRLGDFCSSCHGTKGSGPGETIPYIGGQTKEYIAASMKEMRDKTRRATLMQKISQGYSDEEIDAIAAWYWMQPWKNSPNKISKRLASQGKKLSESCAGCHGPRGRGEAETPRISGQPAKYLYYALLEYKNKERNNEGGGASMEEVTELNDGELKALAEYYSSLR